MNYFFPKKLYGIIGWPLAQSLSPLMHNMGFQILGIPSVYLSWPVPPEDLDMFIRSMRLYGVCGCSVTIPHKIAVLEFVDSVSEGASLAGAVNTLYMRGDELCGENTDIAGFLAPLAKQRLDRLDILLLGAGGAAHAAAAGLKLSGCSNVRVTSPGNKRQYDLATRFGFSAIPWQERQKAPANLIINATPLGMHGENVAQTPYDFSNFQNGQDCIAYDMVYNPVRTRFLDEAAAKGLTTISGLDMFLAQGDAQFRLWTGKPLAPDASHAVAAKLMGREV